MGRSKIERTQIDCYVEIKFCFEGFHFWKDAPKDVSFLRNLHRHLFHVSIVVKVDHLDRSIEYFQLKRKAMKYIPKLQKTLKKGASCEMVAHELSEYIYRVTKSPYIRVKVSEDGENSSIVERRCLE